jgi:hypothetical protein
MNVRMSVTLAVAATLIGCAGHQGGAGEDPPAPPPDTVTGTVQQVGSVPFLITVIRGDEDTAAVSGELEEEIARLVGARVQVTGVRSEGSFPGPTVEASAYRILSIDGEEPTMGILRVDGDGYYLETAGDEADRRGLTSVPEGLRDRVGARVWVILAEGGGTVLRYGVLRPEPEGEER